MPDPATLRHEIAMAYGSAVRNARMQVGTRGTGVGSDLALWDACKGYSTNRRGAFCDLKCCEPPHMSVNKNER
jgi:hypothetical protein